MLRSAAGVAADVAELTGMIVERRAEGVALLDVSGMFSDRRFPGGGTVAQVALLLANRIADRVLDPDALPLSQLTAPEPGSARLVLALDRSMPRTDLMAELDPGCGRIPPPTPTTEHDEQDAEPEQVAAPPRYPLLEDGWLRGTVAELIDSYGATFGAVWVADPDRLLAAAAQVLTDLAMVAPGPRRGAGAAAAGPVPQRGRVDPAAAGGRRPVRPVSGEAAPRTALPSPA